MDFEKSSERLEAIIKLLEDENTSLENSMALFSEAVEIVKNCQNTIKNAKDKMAELLQIVEEE